MSTGVRELRVWQESVSLAGDVIRAVKTSIRRETKSVTDSLMATAIDIGTNIADGYAATRSMSSANPTPLPAAPCCDSKPSSRSLGTRS